MKRIVVLSLVFCMAIVWVISPARAESSNTMNFRFNPLGLLIGALDINLDFQLNEEWTIGPELALINFEHDREGVLTEDIEIKDMVSAFAEIGFPTAFSMKASISRRAFFTDT